jgi:hypothetical protein
LGDASSCLCLLGKNGDFLCSRCFRLRCIAETEEAERTRQRRARIGGSLRLGSIIGPILLASAIRTETTALVALAVFVTGSVAAEAVSPSAFRSWMHS